MSLLPTYSSPGEESSSGEAFIQFTTECLYLDRMRSPQQTLELISPLFDRHGITRIAEQTDLDHIGIPCFAAYRPNAKTLVTAQGKGLTREAAMVSAAMEAIELSVAERPNIKVISVSARDLSTQLHHIVNITSQLPIGEMLPADKKIAWATGTCLRTGKTSFVPLDAISMDSNGTDLPAIGKNTNGLASGNSTSEAIFHGLCELVERDAGSLWSLKTQQEQARTAIDPSTWRDPEVLQLLQAIQLAKLKIRLFDHTCDTGVPCVMAVLGDPRKTETCHFDLAAGYGAHPNAPRAAIRAITEAAQTRITSVSGARDDIIPTSYTKKASKENMNLLNVEPIPERRMSPGLPLGTSLPELLRASLHSTLSVSPQSSIYAFPLNTENGDYSVIRLVAPFLEDRDVNSNWRPQERALKVILQQ